MRTKFLALATGAALIAGTGIASAATVATDLNLRAGPGTNYPVIDAMPAGAQVNIRTCSGSWCRVSFRGETGWASANYLGGGGATTVYRRSYVEPGNAYAPPPAYYDYGYGPYAYEPGFSVGIGFGGFGGGWHHGGWHGGHHWHH
jgi:uncharacterized protein YraI